jgi:glucan 1,3-beta-glucosidase
LVGDGGAAARSASRRRRQYILATVAAVVVAAAVLIPVGIIHGSKKNARNTVSSSGNNGGDGNNGGGNNSTNHVTGGNATLVTTENGTTCTYINNFGGYWYWDPKDPFNNNAQPNSWTPPLNQSWNWGTNRVYGVNLGGWFVLEPFIIPSLFQKYPTAVDEWTLSQAMAADTSSGGGLSQIENHYDTFITEEDIAQIAGAGLNWIRLPIPFWAVGEWSEVGEPFLARTSWKYILRLFRWARKYGLRINLDLHTIPGCQNGYNHCGKVGQINFMNGVMGYANAQRTLDYIRFITEFINQPEYQDLIPMFSIVNEALTATIGVDVISHLYAH